MRDDLPLALPRPPRPAARVAAQMLAGLAIGAGLLGVWLASGLLVPEGLRPETARLQGLTTIFLGIFIEALPFLLAGVLASSAIHVFVSVDHIRRLSPRDPVRAAALGALLGLAFPVCECGAVPATRRLLADEGGGFSHGHGAPGGGVHVTGES